MRAAVTGLLLIWSLTITTFGQDHQPFIRGCLPEIRNNKIYLQAFYGSSAFIVDSSYADVNGCFILTPPLNRQGFYRILFPGRRFMDIIFSDKNIYFQSRLNKLIDSTQFINDAENQLYYTYLQHRLQWSEVTSELQRMMLSDTSGTIYKNARKEFMQLQHEEAALIRKLSAKQPASLVTSLMQIDRTSSYDPNWSKAVRDQYMFDHFLDYADFTDSALLYTNALSAKMISYLERATLTDQDKNINEEFLEASLNLLAATGYSKPVFDFVRDYLIAGFDRLRLDSLSKTIETITYPCCACSKTGMANKDVNAIKRQKLPKLKLFNEKQKITLPKSGASYILIFTTEKCSWNDKLFKELDEALLTDFFSKKYIPLIIHPNASSENSPFFFKLTKRSAIKLAQADLTNTFFPEVWIIDESGIIQEILPNWLIFRRWILSQFPS